MATWAPLALTTLPLLATAQSGPEVWPYTITRGDTLLGLHRRLLRPEADWRTVQRLNRITDPRHLRPGSVLYIPLALLRADELEAEVLHAHGEVWLERSGQARRRVAAAERLRAGDVVLTGAQSSLSLRFGDGTRTLLGPEGRLRIEQHMRRGAAGVVDTRVRLDGGAVDTRVEPALPAPRFELRTPVVNLGVRGTEFRARTDGERTLAEVVAGRVALNAQPLEAGFGAVATREGVGAARALLPAPDLGAVPARIERLPQAAASSADAVAAPEPPALAPGRTLSVLLAEDNEVNVLLFRAMLEGQPVAIDVAPNGPVALDLLARRHYDLAFIDVQMPGLDGLSVTRELRHREQATARPRTPVVALTANAYASDVQASLEAGCDRHVAKPFNRATLLDCLARLPAPAAAAAARPQADADTDVVVDSPRAIAMLGGDAALYARVAAHARVFIAGWSDDYDAALAGDLPEPARRLTHDPKAIAGSLGADALADAAARLEAQLRSGPATAADAIASRDVVLAAITPVLAELSRHGTA